MDQDLYKRLKRLGVVRGARQLKSTEQDNQPPQDDSTERIHASRRINRTKETIEKLLPGGRIEETAVGSCFVIDQVYPGNYRHGSINLGVLLQQRPEAAALFSQDEQLKNLNFSDFLFIDTETTGLAGAGTLAFMVGAAFFEKNNADHVFVVRQYFLRDHGDEPAMLHLLGDLLAGKSGLISFNGQSFDVPLLNNRYLMNRMPSPFFEVPHIDLLRPSRRIWRYRLGSVALGALEKNLIGVQRTEDDVPGWLIPGLYNDYLRSGDGREIRRIFYHNQIDMLSMVTLAAEINRQFGRPSPEDSPEDLFSLGKWQVDLGLLQTAESNLRMAITGDPPLSIYHQSLSRLALLFKRTGRREEAVPLWQQWAATSFDDVQAHIELAKHYEWHEKDLKAAEFWTQEAIALTGRWQASKRIQWELELTHRLGRLQRKRKPTN